MPCPAARADVAGTRRAEAPAAGRAAVPAGSGHRPHGPPCGPGRDTPFPPGQSADGFGALRLPSPQGFGRRHTRPLPKAWQPGRPAAPGGPGGEATPCRQHRLAGTSGSRRPARRLSTAPRRGHATRHPGPKGRGLACSRTLGPRRRDQGPHDLRRAAPPARPRADPGAKPRTCWPPRRRCWRQGVGAVRAARAVLIRWKHLIG